PRTGHTIDVLSSKQFVTGRAHIVELYDELRTNLMLHSEEPVRDVGFPNSFGKHDGGRGCEMGIVRIPTRDIPGGLPPGILFRGRRAHELGGSSSRGPVHYTADVSHEKIAGTIQ